MSVKSTVFVDPAGHSRTEEINRTMAAVAMTLARFKLVNESASGLTDNSNGSADSGRDVEGVLTAFANEAETSFDLADKTETEAAMTAIRNAATTIAAVQETIAGHLGIATLTDNSGGSDGSGTIAAIAGSVAGAQTGVQATEMNTFRLAVNEALYILAQDVNKVCRATGVDELDVNITGETWEDTIGAIPVDGGTAADPGVSKAAVDSAISQWRNDVATIAARLNAVVAAKDPLVRVK